MNEQKQTRRVATKLNPLLHAEFICATRLNNETMNGALRRFAKQYTEEVKSELLRTAHRHIEKTLQKVLTFKRKRFNITTCGGIYSAGRL